MTPTDRIRTAIEAEIQRSPAPPTTDDLAAAVCEALADEVAPETECEEPEREEWIGQSAWAQSTYSKRHKILAIAAALRGEVRDA